ncbi:sugar phosphate nucleotidyltransferase, partial [bacterium]|nr:sugar phosphate nucleotidyltransferase [bacterium]
DGSRYGVKLTISEEKERLGTAGPIKLLEETLTEPFLVMNGDILCNLDFKELYDFGLSQDSPLTITVKKIIMPYAFGNIFFEGNKVTGIEEKPDIVTHALAGIYFMKPEIFKYIPEESYYGMDSLIKDLLENGRGITKFDLKSYWLDIGRIDDYEQAQDEFNKNFYGESESNS